MRAGAIAVALAATTLAVAGCGGGPLDAAALQKEAEAIASIATEGALLASRASDGSAPDAFVRVHADELAKTAGEEAKKLRESKSTGPVRDDARKAEALARRVSELLARLASSPDDGARARSLAERLREEARAAKELAAQ